MISPLDEFSPLEELGKETLLSPYLFIIISQNLSMRLNMAIKQYDLILVTHAIGRDARNCHLCPSIYSNMIEQKSIIPNQTFLPPTCLITRWPGALEISFKSRLEAFLSLIWAI